VDKLGSILTVAMVDPFDSVALEEIREHTGLRVKPVLSNWYDFELVFARLFGTRQAEGKSDADAFEQTQEPGQPEVDQPVATTDEGETDDIGDAAASVDLQETVAPPETDEQDEESGNLSDVVELADLKETAAPPEIEEEDEPTNGISDATDSVKVQETSAPPEIEKETGESSDAVETPNVEETLAPPETEEAEGNREVGVPLEGHKVVPRIARLPKAREFKDADDEVPIPEYTFENFLVGQVNTFTYAIARAVADAPGAEYNPLFIYGDVGLGKTHLVCAIGNEVLAKQPEKRVLFTSSGTFGTRLVEAIQRHDVPSFREYYTKRDLLIMDDAQFLAGREKTQEEFFEIFNAFHDEHKQIIIASDKPPAELVALERRIVSRFAGGIVAGLAAPEWETRMAILKHQVDTSGCEVPEEVLSLVATRVPDDVRGLLGALHKIMAFCELVQQDMTSDLAQEILDHLFEKRHRRHK
jgi:chromosomal replication initiator protein DnaA